MANKSWELEDAQQIAEEYPYTFYKPSNEVIEQLDEGNLVKLIFRFESKDPEAPNAERMWVSIKNISNQTYLGELDNDPAYIKDLKYLDKIEFEEKHIIDTDLTDPVPSIVESYIKRCFVTNNILYEGEPVGYLYREDPDQEDDSGWRFTTGRETDEYMDNLENTSYVSIGAVLSQDDSFVELLELPSGAAFVKNNEGDFVEVQ